MRSRLWVVLLLLSVFGPAVGAWGCDEGPTQEIATGGSGVVGALGGFVRSDDGRVRLEIPVGALSEEVSFSIAPLADAPAGHLGGAYEVGPSGTVFAQPVRVVMQYDPAGLGGVSEYDLRVAVTESTAWEPLEQPFVDLEAMEVIGETTHLSSFALVAAGCFRTTDCVAPQQCLHGTCRMASCQGDAECASAEVCDQAMCVTAQACATDEECDAAQRCASGVCRTRLSCASSAECGDQELCVDGLCVSVGCSTDDDCPEGGICRTDGQCGQQGACSSDAECTVGHCRGGLCDPYACLADADCELGSTCVDAVCVVRTACAADGDCAAGRVCVGGVCSSP